MATNNTAAVQVLITLNDKTITAKANKKNVVSLKVSRVLGDAANKFTLELFDETAWKLESALYKTQNTPISIQYGATGNWSGGNHITFAGICTNYNLSFVGAATMLSIEGIVTGITPVDGVTAGSFWFRNDTICWVDTNVSEPKSTDNFDINDVDYRRQCSVDGKWYKAGVGSNDTEGFDDIGDNGDYADYICARLEWLPPNTDYNSTDRWKYRVLVNPTNIFKRIIRKYNGEIGAKYEPKVTLGDTVSKNTDIRITPNITSSIIGNIPANAKFTEISDMGQWLKINYNGIEGWIPKANVTTISTTEIVQDWDDDGNPIWSIDLAPKIEGYGHFKIGECDDSLWVDARNLTLTQTSESAATFIQEVLCKAAIKPGSNTAGFDYYLNKKR